MRAKLTSILLPALTVTLLSGGAQAYEKCEPFSVFSNIAEQKRVAIDHGDKGPSVGDRRIASWPLRDENGDVVGQFDAEGTAHHPDSDGNLRSSADVMVQLPTGVLLYKVVPAPAMRDFIGDTSGPAVQPSAARVITGGSGVFEGATGTVDITRGDTTVEYRFNVSCPSVH